MTVAAAGTRRKLRNQLHYLEGQMSGVGRMLDADRSSGDVAVQLQAITAGVARALALLAEDEARIRLRAELEQKLLACPGACDYCDQILAIFDQLNLNPRPETAAALAR